MRKSIVTGYNRLLTLEQRVLIKFTGAAKNGKLFWSNAPHHLLISRKYLHSSVVVSLSKEHQIIKTHPYYATLTDLGKIIYKNLT